MKMICLEEHTVDAAIAKAGMPAQEAQAGYMTDWGSEIQDNPPMTNDDRPHLLSIRKTMGLAADIGAGRIAEMDEHEIDMQVLSFSNSPQLASDGDALDLTRRANDRLAEAVQKYPRRFAAFATLPWQDPEAAANELERTVKDLRMVGTLLTGRPGDTFLDDSRYEPVLAKLDELKVPLYVHPGFPLPQVQEPYYSGFNKEVTARLSLFGWGWHNEAGVHVIRMMLSGIFDKFRSLQVISGHWGEMVPFYLQRMDDAMPQEATKLSRSITETYKAHVYVTPSGMLNLPHFEFIHKVLGANRILYSVDYPYLTLTGARKFLEDLPVNEQDKEKIAHGNAETLLRLQ